jgi:5'-3' exonuclease
MWKAAAMATGDRLLLLDTASLYFRAFFGVPDSVKAPDGTPVNAVRGLMDFISRLVGEYDPTHLACCWDDDWRPQWRVDLIPSYKAHRVVQARPGSSPDVEEVPDPLETQVPIIVSVLEAYGIPIVGHAEMEADDVIGTLATDAGMPVDIVTGDRDLFQLVDDDAEVRVLYTARGVSKHDRVDNAWVRDKYGIDARQYADFATLRGDTSDGLPGVAGVGDKTAATLLNRFGTIDAIVEAAGDPDSDMGPGPRGKIKAAADYLAVAPQVVAVRRDLDLGSPDLVRPRTPEDHSLVVALDEKWGLGSSAVRLVEALSGSH